MRFLIIICLLFSAPSVFSQSMSNVCEIHHCMAVVDVGSTGSRLHLYSYDLDKYQTPIQIETLWSKKITPGFATLDINTNQIENYLSNLFSNDDKINQVPVYFYATAGMRLIPAEKQKAYYENIKQWFSKQTQWKLIEAKTINGRDEGMYGWLAVNYQLGTLANHTASSIGVMDMGGSSVQIIFSAEDKKITIPSAHVAQFNLYGQSFTIFSYSVLGLGQSLVQQQFLNTPTCFSKDYPLADGGVGLGQAWSCQEDISHLINDVHHVSDALQPVLNAQSKSWYAMSGVSYLAQHQLFNFKDRFTSFSLLSIAQQKACQVSWAELENSTQSTYNLCLNASYYYALMVHGYGISENQTIYLAPENASWTLGVVLLH